MKNKYRGTPVLRNLPLRNKKLIGSGKRSYKSGFSHIYKRKTIGQEGKYGKGNIQTREKTNFQYSFSSRPHRRDAVYFIQKQPRAEFFRYRKIYQKQQSLAVGRGLCLHAAVYRIRGSEHPSDQQAAGI